MNSKKFKEFKKVEAHLYNDPSVENLDLAELASYLESKTPIKRIETRGPLIKSSRKIENLPEKLAKTRVRDPETPKTDFDPLYGEINFEERLIQEPSRKVSGVLYDGSRLAKIFRKFIPEEELNFSHLHIVFTNRLFGSWDENDKRYHARVSVYGFPSLISTTGIVEAPAKPKEFYRKKHQLARVGNLASGLEKLKKEFEGRFIDYDDERLTEIMKGYAIQAIFHHFFANPFCENKNCRLYNAHWQEEVLQAQLESPEFCENHKEIIQNWKNK